VASFNVFAFVALTLHYVVSGEKTAQAVEKWIATVLVLFLAFARLSALAHSVLVAVDTAERKERSSDTTGCFIIYLAGGCHTTF
jgi:hypothetical protein